VHLKSGSLAPYHSTPQCVKPNGQVINSNDEKPLIRSPPAVKITGTFAPLASTSDNTAADVPALPAIPCIEHCASTSRINESLVSTIVPALSSSVLKEDVPAFMSSDEFSKSESLLDVMNFPNVDDDMELGNFLLDAADWL